MYVLHTTWRPPGGPAESGRIFFWAESAAEQPARPRQRRGQAALHPYCAPVAQVLELLGQVGAVPAPAEASSIKLWLPTGSSGPQPSPQLQHDWIIEAGQPAGLAAWTVAGVEVAPGEAAAWLANLPGPTSLPAHIRLGADCRYWATAASLALETLTQQKLLPALVRVNDKTFYARWQPVLDGPQDGARLARLLAAMPPLCRAEAPDPAAAPSPRLLLDTFLNATVDALARRWGRAASPAPVTGIPWSPDPTVNWTLALFTPGGQVTGTPAQLDNLYQSYRLWLRNLHIAGDKTFRVAFRLEAPAQQETDGTAKNWLLHFLLQSREDPSLLVPAEQVWQTRGSELRVLHSRFEQPQEKLLAGLGYAASLFEPLREGLKTARPVSLAMTAGEAFRFLREVAPLLEASGFGLLVPPWWNRPGMRLGVRLKMAGRTRPTTVQRSTGDVSMDKLVRYQWELAVGEMTLSHEEFEALARLKSPLVQLRGQWVQLDPEQVDAAIRFWEQQDLEAETSLAEAAAMGLGAKETVEGLPIQKVEYEGWLADWMERFTGDQKLALLPPPAGLQAQLRPYQQYGYSWLDFLRRWGLGACLADDMGLGKTLQTIALVLQQKADLGRLPGPVLVICPTSVVSNWARETQRFAPDLAVLQHHGPDRLRDDAFRQQAAAADLVLSSYAVVRRDAAVMTTTNWFGVVLDEAQNIKNPETQQARVARQLPAQFRVALTGTPVENRLSELWSIMQFLNPDYLGSAQKFRQNFALPIEQYGDEEARQRLKKVVAPFILRRVKTDPSVIQDLPEKQEMKVYCNLTEEQATLYEAVVRTALEGVDQAEGIERRGLILGMLMKLKQVCNHPAQFLHQVGDGYQVDPAAETSRSGKLARLTEMSEEALSVGDRILVFTQFAEMGELLKSHLQQHLGVPSLFLHGGIPAKKRAYMVQRFQEDDGPPIFILSIKAGGTGLNLTRANHVFHFDRWWNPAVEDQATDRAFRIGQVRNVQVHKFICVGTMEEMIDNMIERKKGLAQSIIGSGESWLTELSTEELRELVRLRGEAVA